MFKNIILDKHTTCFYAMIVNVLQKAKKFIIKTLLTQNKHKIINYILEVT